MFFKCRRAASFLDRDGPKTTRATPTTAIAAWPPPNFCKCCKFHRPISNARQFSSDPSSVEQAICSNIATTLASRDSLSLRQYNRSPDMDDTISTELLITLEQDQEQQDGMVEVPTN